MTQALAQALAARLPPLLVAAERVAAILAAGAHGRRRAGPGETFWQYRRFQPGDAAAAIDWRRSARSQGLYVRETEWAAAQSVFLWRDPSPSMAWRSRRDWPEKRERAELLVLALAASLLRGGEKVALLAGGLPPSSGGGTLERLGAAMLAERVTGEGLPRPGALPRGAELVLVSDFLMPPEVLERDMRALAAAGATGHLVQVLDPAEESLPYDGRVRFSGLEGEGEALVRRAEDLRAAYGARLSAHREAVAALARALGWSFAVHHTDGPPQMALLALHQRLGGAGPGRPC